MTTAPPVGLLKKEEEPPVELGTVATQGHALTALRETGAAIAGGNLLQATGPLAELTAADARGILDEARKMLITKKGRGVVFEAATVVQLQEAQERYGINLSARLATTTNNPRADVFVRDSFESAKLTTGEFNEP